MLYIEALKLSLKDSANESDKFLTGLIDNTIERYVIVEMNKFKKLEFRARWMARILSITIYILLVSVPLLIYTCRGRKEIPMVVSIMVVILSVLKPAVNTSFYTLASGQQKGALAEWDLHVSNIKASGLTDPQKIEEYKKVTKAFLSLFNENIQAGTLAETDLFFHPNRTPQSGIGIKENLPNTTATQTNNAPVKANNGTAPNITEGTGQQQTPSATDNNPRKIRF